MRVYQTVLPQSFDNQIETVEDHLYDFSSASLEKDHLAELRESLHRLFVELVEPIESWFPGTSLVIIPDRELLFIPFDALMREKPRETDLYSSNSYMVRDYSISYLPVSGFLKKPEPRLVKKAPRLNILAQDYALNSRGNYSTLTGVRQEVDDIQKLMKTRLLDYEGSKDLLKSDIEKTRLLHFAMHSYPSSEEQDASFLVLNSQSDSTNNNLLFDYEVEPLNLSDDMVVLNSCESGGGKQIDGEGMMSFSRSFILAGAKSVVQALWPVDDKSGSTIMVQFYKDLLRGRDKPDALQKAQISYLESCSPSFTHPYFWAGYQVIGETGPIATPYTRTGITIAGVLIIGILIYYRRKQYKHGKG
jgi:CHAT domain-containing protein